MVGRLDSWKVGRLDGWSVGNARLEPAGSRHPKIIENVTLEPKVGHGTNQFLELFL